MGERVDIVKRHLTEGVKPSPNHVSYVEPATYQYTLEEAKTRLTKEQRDFYEQNGFLVIRKLVDLHTLEKFRTRFQQIHVCGGEVDTVNMTIMRDVAIAQSEFVKDEKAITKIQNFENDPVMFEYCCLPKIVDYAKCFLGENIMSMHTMLINKPPDPGQGTSRHPMHQDLHYFPFRPADRIVCSWTAMQDVNRQNGCLVAVPGSHKDPGELLEHGYPNWKGGVNMGYHGILNYDPEKHERVHLEMGPGDTVFFHPLLVHGSGMNRTDGFRKSISCHYASAECEYIDVSGTTQDIIQAEVRDGIRRKLRLSEEQVNMIDFMDIWKAKTRLVSGQEVNL